MSTKTLGWLVRAKDGKKLGFGWDPVNSIPTLSQSDLFQTFLLKSQKPNILEIKLLKHENICFTEI